MKVRKAKEQDHKTIVDFQLTMARETEGIELHQPTVEEGVYAVFSNPSKGCYYVAETDEQVVGSLLTTFEWSDWRNGTVLWIQSVYVRPEFRRKGIYRRMYSFLKQKVMDDQSLKGIRLYADKSNQAAHKTYETLGMNQDHYITFEWLK
ncbi:GNAT family N-acetyltransferase [uncultured Draconibacterium sp.]|uniref:GNAT family N-acetyltransferase n=1 Tax=uncultured Draconibacterium sp. TaxID=1573823 RepID=UPI0025FD313D|nr:GNAT family N-acetyltransferase [uncultured Draconibacterium sp.]